MVRLYYGTTGIAVQPRYRFKPLGLSRALTDINLTFPKLYLGNENFVDDEAFLEGWGDLLSNCLPLIDNCL